MYGVILENFPSSRTRRHVSLLTQLRAFFPSQVRFTDSVMISGLRLETLDLLSNRDRIAIPPSRLLLITTQVSRPFDYGQPHVTAFNL